MHRVQAAHFMTLELKFSFQFEVAVHSALNLKEISRIPGKPYISWSFL